VGLTCSFIHPWVPLSGSQFPQVSPGHKNTHVLGLKMAYNVYKTLGTMLLQKSGKSTTTSSWQARVPPQSYRLAVSIWELQIYVCGFISRADLENNSLKHPLNEGQVSRSERRLRPPSLPQAGCEVSLVTREAVRFPGAEMKSAREPRWKLSGALVLKQVAVPFVDPERRCPLYRCSQVVSPVGLPLSRPPTLPSLSLSWKMSMR